MTSIRITSNIERARNANAAEPAKIVDWRTDDPRWMSSDSSGDNAAPASLIVPTLLGLAATAIAVAMIVVTFL